VTVPRDPGLQPERTALAWSRTGLAVLVNALLVVRAGIGHGAVGVSLMGALLLGGAVVLMAAGAWRGRALRGDWPVAAPPEPLVLGLAATVLTACLAAVVVTWLEAGAPHLR